MRAFFRVLLALACCLAQWSLAASPLDSRRESNITATKHNLSTTGLGTVTSDPESSGGTAQVCVFCHTPHGATQAELAPLWNKAVNSGAYTMYGDAANASNSSFQATIDANPGGASKLCLSCHDGTLAIGSVNVIDGRGSQTISLTGTDAGSMPAGEGLASGFTRNLGTDLKNDHPISLVYDSALASSDGELFDPLNTTAGRGEQVGVRGSSSTPGQPRFPLEGTDAAAGKLQCTTCHDPHTRGVGEDVAINIKFLRGNRFQQSTPSTANHALVTYDEDNDIICLACHNKDGWADSAHANPTVADERYEPLPAQQRAFPNTLDGAANNAQVWQVACLNCHDTHTKQGARRLLREGSTGPADGDSAIEQTCFQCHDSNGGILDASAANVPAIKPDFDRTSSMPIVTARQDDTSQEIHDIRDKDFAESQANLASRHVECTDCHNPHRLRRVRRADAAVGQVDTVGTHPHIASGTQHNNVISGVLAGAFGVEPTGYAGSEFKKQATSLIDVTFKALSGAVTGLIDAGLNTTNYTFNTPPQTYDFVSREYQICMKCHSSYAFGTSPPNLKSIGGSYNSNDVTRVTDQALEFYAPLGHEGEPLGVTGTGAFNEHEGGSQYNHRSWHPVMRPTGRTSAVRGSTDANWKPPFNNAVGTQSMYCSDCHGSDTPASFTNSEPTGGDAGNPWGPHGSNYPFILRGDWALDNWGAPTMGNNALCFRCHDSQYRTGGLSASGFWDVDTGKGELHGYHVDKVGNLECNWCHVALPHGWKNKALLVNLNDVGPECDGYSAGTIVTHPKNSGFTCAPYYYNSFLKVKTFRKSGQWRDVDCGVRGGSGGKDWMRNDACDNPN